MNSDEGVEGFHGMATELPRFDVSHLVTDAVGPELSTKRLWSRWASSNHRNARSNPLSKRKYLNVEKVRKVGSTVEFANATHVRIYHNQHTDEFVCPDPQDKGHCRSMHSMFEKGILYDSYVSYYLTDEQCEVCRQSNK